MERQWNGIERRKSLRVKAEALIAGIAPQKPLAEPADMLLHELLVHKIELEMQNEELRNSHNALQETLERYRDLYEFAPVGYISIDRQDQINDINLTGATLLGVDRSKLIHQRFSKFVCPQDSDLWYRLFQSMMGTTGSEPQSLKLALIRADGSPLYAHLDCRRGKAQEISPMLSIMLTDVGKSERGEKE